MKFYLVTFILIIFGSIYAQNNCFQDSLNFQIKKNKYHTLNNGYPDSILVSGKVVSIKPGICGSICRGGLIKIELTNKPINFPDNVMYIAITCYKFNQVCGKEITLHVNKLFPIHNECFYQYTHNFFDQNDFPFYFASDLLELKRIE